MGEVYRARDTRLNREVAVKVLSPELSSDWDRLRRFEKEAQAASSLNHPNLVTIYEVDRIDSTSIIVMELVAGKTLRELEGRCQRKLGRLRETRFGPEGLEDSAATRWSSKAKSPVPAL